MPSLEYATITTPDDQGHGIGLMDGLDWIIKNCTVDFSICDLDTLDEAFSCTWASSATVTDCTFRGAGKLALCGCGDEDKLSLETGKKVRFENCVFENFSRRAPEAQNGMIVTLIGCTIKNWGMHDRFDTRCFGAWAHKGGSIVAIHCRFEQTSFFQTGVWNFFKDWFAHIGQAFNDEGIRGLFRWKTYLPGVCRGLTAGPDGEVVAMGCTKNHWWIRVEKG